MNTIEPFFGDDVTRKSRLSCTPSALKIPVSEEIGITKFEILPHYTGVIPTRRPSMEPYFQSNTRQTINTSSLSSYAHLSDIFDYHYLNLSDFLDGVPDENVILSDSDTEPEDYEVHEFNGHKVSVELERARFRRFTTESLARDVEIDDALHFLTFKHNSRSTGAPQKGEATAVSDHFEELESSDANVLTVSKTLRIEPPPFTYRAVEPLDTPSNIQLAEYLAKCSNPLSSKITYKTSRECQAQEISNPQMRKACDWFEGVKTPPFLLDSKSSAAEDFLI